MGTAEPPQFPSPVYDEAGAYNGGGSFRISSDVAKTVAILIWTERDLSTALEMIRECCKDEWVDHDSPINQALWWSAVVIYGKPFKKNYARDSPLPSWAYDHLKSQVDAEALDLHEYIMHLRDKMMAHDDGLGERKDLVLFLPQDPPAHHLFIGIGTSNRRTIGLGTKIAKQLEPHFAEVHRIFSDLCNRQRDAACQHLLNTGFADVTLLAPFVEEDPCVDIQRVLERFGRAGEKRGRQEPRE